MNSINQINLEGKKVLVRVDFNVPLNQDKQITDDTRIKAAIPTIEYILNHGGSVILMSHLGRPQKKLNTDGTIDKDALSLAPIAKHLADLLHQSVQFIDDCIGEKAIDASRNLKQGEILLLENTRFYKEEEKGDANFAKQLADLGDVYINDAFGTAHRAHASTTIMAQYFDKNHKTAGFLMKAEVDNANKVLHQAEKPLTAIIGGAKVSDKILIIENLLNIAQNIIIGGGMAYTFIKAQGGKIGNSLVEDDRLDLALSVLEKAKQNKVNIYLPEDSVIADAFSNDANYKTVESNEIPENWMGLDIATKAIATFDEVIANSKTILWNGPMGVFEMENFRKGTEAIAKAVANATANGAFSLVGGGDSVAAINLLQLNDKVSYVSTGGGAMLEFFEGKTLPGVAALD
ncbi:MAG: phosphoglycerate kinase [Chitinophagales bacterium]|nr:phosphoglycerate kinase [Chitinophagales bacterium]